MSFTILYNEKTPFQAIKTQSSKSRKIEIFPKGLTHGFGPKMAIFPTCFFQAIQARKMSFTIFQNEKTPFQAIKKEVQKVEKFTFFQRGQPMLLVQKWPFWQLFFFQAIQDRKMSFTIFQNEKTPFQSLKTRSLKSRKSDIFPKGLIHSFCTKLAIFPTFFVFGNISQENVFYDILQQKNAFLGYKNNKFKKSKN